MTSDASRYRQIDFAQRRDKDRIAARIFAQARLGSRINVNLEAPILRSRRSEREREETRCYTYIYMRNEIGDGSGGIVKRQDRRIPTTANNDVKGCVEERVILDTGGTRATH